MIEARATAKYVRTSAQKAKLVLDLIRGCDVNRALATLKFARKNEESSAHARALQAILNVTLGKEPQVGTISWMVPVCEALQDGGIQEARARYAAIKDDPGYFFQAEELVTLVYQLMSVKKFDLAIEVLDLNLSVFPDHADSCTISLLKTTCVKVSAPSLGICSRSAWSCRPANPWQSTCWSELDNNLPKEFKMDKQGFQIMLEGRGVPAGKMDAALALAVEEMRNYTFRLPVR